MCSRLEMTNCGLVRSRTQKNFDDWFRKLQELERVVLCIILMHLFCFHELVVKVLLALTQSSCVCSRYDARAQSTDTSETWHANSEEASGSSINSWRSNFQVAEWNGDGVQICRIAHYESFSPNDSRAKALLSVRATSCPSCASHEHVLKCVVA